MPSGIDMAHYCWRQRRADASGDERLLVPTGFDDDFLFASHEEAVTFLNETGFIDEYDPTTWMLVRYAGSIIPDVLLGLEGTK
jgi:hypothetical protein